MKLWFLLVIVFFHSVNAVDIKVVGGYNHTIALKDDGTLLGFGNNGDGKLGLGDMVGGSLVPVAIEGITGIVDIAVGEYHTVALKSDGTLLVGGENGEGQLGLGEAVSKTNLPTPLPGITNIIAVAANYYHTIALKDDGTLLVWGYNGNGQLGLGDSAESNYYTPTPVPGVDHVIAISTNERHTVALKDDGTMLAWGDNGDGQLGLGDTEDQLTPMAIPNESNITAIVAGGSYSIALKNDGTMLAWGDNYYGQLGLGNNDRQLSPIAIPNVDHIIAITTGYAHSMAVKDDGTLLTWGYNRDGQLGVGDTDDRNTPMLISGVDNLSDITAGWDYSVGINHDGTLLAWGVNYSGQLGLGDNDGRRIPISVNAYDAGDVFTNNIAISAGSGQTHSINNDGTVWGWGKNSNGVLGLGDNYSARNTPTLLDGDYNIKSIQGENHNIALKHDGTMLAWGYNNRGQLGLGTTVSEYYSPTVIPNESNISAVSAKGSSSIALKNDGTMLAWGYNRYGQLGLGNTTDKHIPTTIPNESNISAIATGGSHTLALKNDGTMLAWGSNQYGRLGLDDNTSINLLVPTVITQDDNVTAINNIMTIVAGAFHSVAIKTDRTLLAWGYNNFGQLGDSSTIQRNRPVSVSGASDIVAVDVGASHTIALKSDGTMLAWGYNSSGQLGLGNNESTYYSPTPIPGVDNIIAIAAQSNYTIALKSDGTMLAWGDNGEGQLGLGDTINRNSPQLVREFKALTLRNMVYMSPAIIMYLLN